MKTTIRNTHPLRKRIDCPKSFWTHCFSELNAASVRSIFEQDADKISFDGEEQFFILTGDKGTLVRKGLLSSGDDCKFIRTEGGAIFPSDMVKFEHLNLQDIVTRTLDKGEFVSFYRVHDKITFAGVLVGRKEDQYSTLLHIADGKIAFLDLEFKENAHNHTVKGAFGHVKQEQAAIIKVGLLTAAGLGPKSVPVKSAKRGKRK